MDEIVDLDAKGVLSTLDPSEFRAAYDYWSSYSPELLDGIADFTDMADDEGISWDLISAKAGAQERNGRMLAVYKEASFALRSTNSRVQADLRVDVTQTSVSVSGTLYKTESSN